MSASMSASMGTGPASGPASQSTDLMIVDSDPQETPRPLVATQPVHLSDADLDLLNHTIAKDLTADEMRLFGRVCMRMQLDPFMRQIYAIVRGSGDRRRLTFQVSIDGFRALSERTNKYAGMRGPYWCGADGEWRDAWLSDKPPVACRVGILRRDFAEPVWATGRYNAYKVDTNALWATMGDTMLAKCIEAAARRIAFPDTLSGIYVPEEMEQADNPPVPAAHAAPVTVTEGQARDRGMPHSWEGEPATQQQLDAIAKVCHALDKPVPTETLTKSQAGQLITQLSAEYQRLRNASDTTAARIDEQTGRGAKGAATPNTTPTGSRGNELRDPTGYRPLADKELRNRLNALGYRSVADAELFVRWACPDTISREQCFHAVEQIASGVCHVNDPRDWAASADGADGANGADGQDAGVDLAAAIPGGPVRP